MSPVHDVLVRHSPADIEPSALWVEDVPAPSTSAIAQRRRAAELARPARDSRQVLLRYDDGETDLVVVTRHDTAVATATAPAWGLGRGSGSASHLVAIDETGDETGWLVALLVTLRRYDPEPTPVVATLDGSFTADLTGLLGDVRPAAVGQPAAVGLLWHGERVDGEYLPCLSPPFPLTVSVYHDESGPRLRLDHSVAGFSPEIAVQFARHLLLVHRQVRQGAIEVSDVELMDHLDQARVAELGRSDPQPPPTANTIHEAFSRIALSTPDVVALSDGAAQLRYGELDELSTRVAHGLRAAGVRDGDRVGVCLDRSASFVVTALGVLKAGATYVPMDPAHPADRLTYTAQDADLALVVTDKPWPGPSVTPQSLLAQGDSQAFGDTDGGTPAYMIYTSGSTGRPKGVVVPHRNVIALIDATHDEYGLGRGDVWTWFHSSAFDFSIWEIWGCLLTGGRLVVVPHAVSREPEAFRDLLRAHRVTVLSQTPSAFAQLLSVGHTDLAVRLVVFGGEPLDARILLRWFDRHPETGCRVVNMFGITETTVHVTARTVTRADALAGSRSVGRAMPGWHLYVLDQAGRLVPPGVAGEICVGGAGVAAGYFRRDDLTAQRFVPDPFRPGTMYRSGDLGRLRPDGDLDHLGRIDNQVKIRGFRIELDEIRSVLLEDPRVSAATVVVRRDHPDDAASARIDGYVVLTEPADTREIRERTARILPEHMVPSTVTALDELPLTVNGKIDQERLPHPVPVPSEVDSTPTGDELADQLRAIWSRVLGVPVGLDDDFFELGGNSLFAVRIGVAMRAEGLPSVRLRELYRHPTVRGVAGAVRGS